MKNARFTLLVALLVIGVATRLFPHWPNFTALGATALMAGAFFRNKVLALLLPLATLFASDLYINNVIYSEYSQGFTWFTEGFIWIYLGFIANVFIGFTIKDGKNVTKTAIGALFGALAFYLLSNIGAWLSIPLYTKDLLGLTEAYIAGLPFLGNQILANLVYTAILFGAVWSITPKLTKQTISA